MNSYFNVNLEFNHQIIYNKIDEAIIKNNKGYIFIVDANVLTISQKDLQYRGILNSSIVNTCYGSSIAFLASLINKNKMKEEPDIDVKRKTLDYYASFDGTDIYEKIYESLNR